MEGVLGNSIKRSEATRIRKAIKQVRRATDTLLIDVINKVVVILLGTELEQHHKFALSEILVTPRMQNNYLDVRSDEVQIMTLHKSKGLEFDFVFHLDLYDWILPKRVFIDGSYDVVFENEQQCTNLHYVGITRARKGIVLIHSTKRYNGSGDIKNGAPSQYSHKSSGIGSKIASLIGTGLSIFGGPLAPVGYAINTGVALNNNNPLGALASIFGDSDIGITLGYGLIG